MTGDYLAAAAAVGLAGLALVVLDRLVTLAEIEYYRRRFRERYGRGPARDLWGGE